MATQLDRIESRLTKIEQFLRVGDMQTGGLDPADPHPPQVYGTPPVFRKPPFENETEEHFQQRVQRHNNLTNWGTQHDSKVHQGASGILATELSPEDVVFMYHAQHNAQHRYAKAGRTQTPDIYELLLVGNNKAMSVAKGAFQNWTEAQAARGQYLADQGNWIDNVYGMTPLRRAYDQFMSAQGV